ACTDTLHGCSTFVCASPLGCTLGYWKQSQHFDNWVGYSPTTQLADVFPNSSLYGLGGTTLLDALGFGSNGNGLQGGAKILLRQAVAALLNSTNATVAAGYPLTTSE